MDNDEGIFTLSREAGLRWVNSINEKMGRNLCQFCWHSFYENQLGVRNFPNIFSPRICKTCKKAARYERNGFTLFHPSKLTEVLALTDDDLERYAQLQVTVGLPKGHLPLPQRTDAAPCWVRPVLKEGAKAKGTDAEGFPALIDVALFKNK